MREFSEVWTILYFVHEIIESDQGGIMQFYAHNVLREVHYSIL